MSTKLSQQDYYLLKIAEEALEVGHGIMKTLRFGIYDHNPRTMEVNKERIESEIKDLLVAINETLNSGYLNDLPEIPYFDGYRERKDEFLKYLEVSRNLGRVQ